jgi:hypothetical protein
MVARTKFSMKYDNILSPIKKVKTKKVTNSKWIVGNQKPSKSQL